MIVGLALPNWITGFIGVARSQSEKQLEEVVNTVHYMCYVPSFDMVKIPVAKRACVIYALRSSINRYSVEIKLVYADPYGVVNRVCTEFKVNRNLIFPEAFKAVFQELKARELITDYDKVCIDLELSKYVQQLREVASSEISIEEDSPPVKLAMLVASIPDVAQIEYKGKTRYTFRIRGETIDIDLVDIRDIVCRHVYRYVMELAKSR